MRGTVEVTDKKLAANRRNAKRSTGPGTERGKNTSKFNAVTTGLFAKHVVISRHGVDDDVDDDSNPEQQFSKLLEALQEEYKPEGPSEVFCVAQMAECMWRERRISRSEAKLVRIRATSRQESRCANAGAVEVFQESILVLDKALREVKATRILSQETFAELSSALDFAPDLVSLMLGQAQIGSGNQETKFADRLTASIQDAKIRLESAKVFVTKVTEKDIAAAARALPEDSDMEQILRYDRALQKKYDWALQRLLESQDRRAKTRQKARRPAKILAFK